MYCRDRSSSDLRSSLCFIASFTASCVVESSSLIVSRLVGGVGGGRLAPLTERVDGGLPVKAARCAACRPLTKEVFSWTVSSVWSVGSSAAAAAARVLVFGVLEGICRKQIERDRRVQVADLSDLAFAEPMRDAGAVSVGQRR